MSEEGETHHTAVIQIRNCERMSISHDNSCGLSDDLIYSLASYSHTRAFSFESTQV